MAGDWTPAKRPHKDDDDAGDHLVKRPNYDYNNTISVIVGPLETPFTVRKEVICNKSKFFEAACSERWKEGQKKAVHLLDVKPDISHCYIEWVYADVLAVEAIGMDLTNLVDLYLLGDLLDDIKFRNKTMKAIVHFIIDNNKIPSPPNTKLIWEKTPSSSLLRKLIVYTVASSLKSKDFDRYIRLVPESLVQQVAMKLKRQTKNVTADDLQAELAEFLEAEDEAS